MNIAQVGQNSTSPFDAIRRWDEHGNEFWMARELQKLLGYLKWDKFLIVIERVERSINLQGQDAQTHITRSGKLGKAGKEIVEDIKFSRYACYLIAMSGDNSKPEIAQAQSYFAIKTREAEVVIPALSEELQLAKLQNESLRMQLEIAKLADKAQGRQDYRIATHGLATTLLLEGKADTVVEIDREISTVIDPRSNSGYSGQTLPMVKDHLKKMSGLKYKDGAAIERKLEQCGEAGLIATRPITIPHKYIPTENLEKAYQVLKSGDQQALL